MGIDLKRKVPNEKHKMSNEYMILFNDREIQVKISIYITFKINKDFKIW